MEKMEISKEGIALIKRFEGCSLSSYLCQANVPTIGFGSTKGVKMGMEISQERAEALLLEDVADFEDAINEIVQVPLQQNQFDALCSWVFNLGPNNLKSSTLLAVLNQGKYKDVPEQIIRWNKAGGKILEGLKKRRASESLLFQGKEWENV